MIAVQLIIFDLDGTLVDSKEAIATGVNFALKKAGLEEKSACEIISYIGTGVDDLIRKSLGENSNGLFEKTKRIFEEYRKNTTESSFLYPQTKEILEYFRNKTKVIVTNRKYEFARPTLERLGIAGYFEEILGADDLTCMKPSACSLEKAVGKFKADRDKTIIVGDMDVDIMAGKEAGIITCAVTYGIGRREDIIKAGPDYVIDNILELKKIIN